jgi:hypothetical protein
MSVWDSVLKKLGLLRYQPPGRPSCIHDDDEISGEVRQAQQKLESASRSLSRAAQENRDHARAAHSEIAAMLRDESKAAEALTNLVQFMRKDGNETARQK